MYFRFSTVVALLSAPPLAFAQDTPNPFIIPDSGLFATAGVALDLEWTPTTDGTVTLLLRSGPSNNLDKGVVLVAGYQNSGEWTWTPSASLPGGSDYAIEIVDDSDTSEVNYTPQFTLTSSGTTSSSAVVSSSTTLETYSTTGKSSMTAESTVVSSSSSVTVVMTFSTTSASSHPTGYTNGTTTAPHSTGASFKPTSATPASSGPAVVSQGAASRCTAVAGFLGAVAIGAFAL